MDWERTGAIECTKADANFTLREGVDLNKHLPTIMVFLLV